MEDQRRYSLPADEGLGDGMSKVSYRRVIEKIYGLERSREVIGALHQHPFVAAPVVLRRLKQKDEEWRRSQTEWNKVWREIDGKNYYKSLDHQGLTFKNIDKRVLSTKSLVPEIEVLYRERYEGGLGNNGQCHL